MDGGFHGCPPSEDGVGRAGGTAPAGLRHASSSHRGKAAWRKHAGERACAQEPADSRRSHRDCAGVSGSHRAAIAAAPRWASTFSAVVACSSLIVRFRAARCSAYQATVPRRRASRLMRGLRHQRSSRNSTTSRIRGSELPRATSRSRCSTVLGGHHVNPVPAVERILITPRILSFFLAARVSSPDLLAGRGSLDDRLDPAAVDGAQSPGGDAQAHGTRQVTGRSTSSSARRGQAPRGAAVRMGRTSRSGERSGDLTSAEDMSGVPLW